MAKFFNKIRQKLLARNNFRKYLAYAVGEIILIVLGILIALSINNWNEDRKNRELEQKYLSALDEEFSRNLSELQRVMSRNKMNGDNALQLSAYTGPEPPEITNKEFANLVSNAFFLEEVQYRPGLGVLSEIINAGKLNIITNDSLRVALASWDGTLLKVRFQEQEHAATRANVIEMINNDGNYRRLIYNAFGRLSNVPQSRFQEENLHLLKDLEFENQVVGFVHTSRLLNSNYYSELKGEIEKILQLIQEEQENT